jgi:hypothetical protein
MSNAFLLTSSGNLPPAVPTTFVTDSGNAIPVGNELNVLGNDSSADNANGISTTGAGNTVTVVLSNRITGTAITEDAVTPQTIYSFDLGATPATYIFEIQIIAYNVTSLLSAGYTSTSVIRTTGAAGSEINADPGLIAEEGAMSGVVVQNQISGNNIEIVVTGLAASTINWEALTTYIKVV